MCECTGGWEGMGSLAGRVVVLADVWMIELIEEMMVMVLLVGRVGGGKRV